MLGGSWDRKHLLQLEGLSADDLAELLDLAQRHVNSAYSRCLMGRTVANLFFEDSTRTRCSFTIAARRLGADTLDLASVGSSVTKGETILDTVRNLHAMGVDAFVIRTSAAGVPTLVASTVDSSKRLIGEAATQERSAGPSIINAGDGRHEHPTQGLLDLLTLRQRLGDLRGKAVGIVGDINNSRVARSDLHGLTTLGATVVLVGPPAMVTKSFEKILPQPGAVVVEHDLDSVLPSLDAIIMLRVQFERQAGLPNAADHKWEPSSMVKPEAVLGDYRVLYGLSAARAAKLPPHAPVLHPGPMNRGLEIDNDAADIPGRSVILQQVHNGVAVRMAVLAMLCGADDCRDGQ